MEWINIIFTCVMSLLSALGGAGLIFWRQTKRMKEAEAERAEQKTQHAYVEEWKELYNKKEARVNTLEEKLDKMRKERDDGRAENMKITLENQRLQFDKCTVNHCNKRQPPHYYDGTGNEVMPQCPTCYEKTNKNEEQQENA